ncbi:class I SAM-dependent methyltransferase [Actinacidiphila bryophytorum]|uniref:Methyltransferase domain-containing protein n=1 Tax=Actinacidiphila bryophytorum TaxID=1436133 RepID=A0A9W4H271_9ACTN|nr:class I SAM-dependent methyltransferase [Actinacidiphila bryophytorum]MBM9440582.1 methyltransferase domain-containing protein [Actinacidiphila bryophytorum]CAG7645170.1 Methyltransferase domain-containing protein [Actinacidiphila bryophytorum]
MTELTELTDVTDPAEHRSSYRVSSIASSPEREIERLSAQVELFWPDESRHYRDNGLRDGIAMVELGSGPGFTTGKILQLHPAIRVTAVEIDPLLVEVAGDRLSRAYGDRLDIVQASILDTGLPSDTYDFALTRLVLEHLPDPVAAVREVARILKPGGRAVFVDNDFEMHLMTSPHIPALAELYGAYCRSRADEGGNPTIGRELPGILGRGGLSAVTFTVVSAHSDIVGSKSFLGSEGVGIPTKLVRDGYLSGKALGEVARSWRDLMRNDKHAILRQMYLSAGEK